MDKISKLRELSDLYKKNAITKEEFEELKKEIIGDASQIKNSDIQKEAENLKKAEKVIIKKNPPNKKDIENSSDKNILNFPLVLAGILFIVIFFIPLEEFSNILDITPINTETPADNQQSIVPDKIEEDKSESTYNYQNSNKNKEEKKPSNFCDLSTADATAFLSSNYFYLGNNRSSSVSFSINYGSSNSGKIHISGGLGSSQRLMGTFSVSNNSVSINNLSAVAGNFDASNNSGTNGRVSINCDGNLSGALYDRNGNSSNLSIIKK